MITAAGKVTDKGAGKFKSAAQLKTEYSVRYHVSTGNFNGLYLYRIS